MLKPIVRKSAEVSFEETLNIDKYIASMIGKITLFVKSTWRDCGIQVHYKPSNFSIFQKLNTHISFGLGKMLYES